MTRRKPWQELTITDDYMFKLVMGFPHICKHLIERVLGIAVREIILVSVRILNPY